MTDMKNITGAAVLHALADGKRVRRVFGDYESPDLSLDDLRNWEIRMFLVGDWEIVEGPATDAELVAEMRRLAQGYLNSSSGREAANRCADMLEKRKW